MKRKLVFDPFNCFLFSKKGVYKSFGKPEEQIYWTNPQREQSGEFDLQTERIHGKIEWPLSPQIRGEDIGDVPKRSHSKSKLFQLSPKIETDDFIQKDGQKVWEYSERFEPSKGILFCWSRLSELKDALSLQTVKMGESEATFGKDPFDYETQELWNQFNRWRRTVSHSTCLHRERMG